MSLASEAAALGMPVFPCDREKRPIIKGGFKSAVATRSDIETVFRLPGAALIGVPTGQASGLLVIDVDVRDGKQGLAWLDEAEDSLPVTRRHRTRTGGLHLLFTMPKADVRNSAGRVHPGVDVRGNGGYIIHPPSAGYTVTHGAPPAECPRWLLKACLPPQRERPGPPKPLAEAGNEQARRALLRSVDCVAQAMEGGRNDQLNRQAFILGMYVGAGLLDLSDVASNLWHAAKSAGLTDTEIKATLHSGLSAGRTKGGGVAR